MFTMGYNTADMYRSFIRWTEREADKAVALRQEFDDVSLQLSSLPRVLSFHVDGDWPYTDVDGGIEMVCDPDDENPAASFMLNPGTMTAEERDKRCYWQMRVIDVPGAQALARSWMGDAFDPVAAANHLANLNIAPGTDLMRQSIDWSRYQPAADMHQAPVLRVRRYSSRTCGEFINALAAIEAMDLGAVDIEGFGNASEVEPSIAHMPWMKTTVYSTNAGARSELTFKGKAGAPSMLLDQVDSIIWSCAPVEKQG